MHRSTHKVSRRKKKRISMLTVFSGTNGRRNAWLAIGVVLAVALSIVAAVLPMKEPIGGNPAGQVTGTTEELMEARPVDTTTLTGTVRGVYGATIHLEVTGASTDPVRFASVRYETKYSLVNTKKLDSAGNPTVTTIALKDIKQGDTVMVVGDRFIGTAKEFDVVEVKKLL
jgi:hypothetical protein